MSASAAYLAVNVDGYALLLGFFCQPRYRAAEIVAGQLASVALQFALALAIMQSGWGRGAPFVGLAGLVPLALGLRRIAALRRGGGAGGREAEPRTSCTRRGVGRIATVGVVATAGAIDNVLIYSSVLSGRAPRDVLLVAADFAVLTLLLCAGAGATARSRLPMRGLHALRRAAARIAPFMTTAVGVSLLVRFETLAWLRSLG